MTQSLRWKSTDLEAFSDDGKRYEIIDGELYVSRQPHFNHQVTCATIIGVLYLWNSQSHAGVISDAPGLIFAEDDDVAPDIAWISHDRIATALWPDGKLHTAPELVVEVLSSGPANERRDREAKLNLYSRRGVREYWIVNWERRELEVYRRADMTLRLVSVLLESDTLRSPLLGPKGRLLLISSRQVHIQLSPSKPRTTGDGSFARSPAVSTAFASCSIHSPAAA